MTTRTVTIDIVIRDIDGIKRPDLDRWIENQWVRPDAAPTGYVFTEIDMARVRLIHELMNDLQVNDDTMPIVLCLLDQIYDLRRRLRQVGAAIDQTAPPNIRADMIARLIG
ncbi:MULTISPECIES: chaperone modulator CbpM [Acidiphilium]|uniref:Chaperone modulatory protein CbpM n=1 Tax=Acidiphilium rubrum TaxID=526 RepID=A0A8G2CIY9_ACIRU|nr:MULTISPECIES: chaperone modulator CbpM [Acidiphilium]SIQ39049.1 chaperone modulatory protein CbpM [Acidiphilium rubrum]